METFIEQWWPVLASVVTLATAITAVTPTSSTSKAINTVLKVLNIVAGNIMRNKNKDEK